MIKEWDPVQGSRPRLVQQALDHLTASTRVENGRLDLFYPFFLRRRSSLRQPQDLLRPCNSESARTTCMAPHSHLHFHNGCPDGALPKYSTTRNLPKMYPFKFSGCWRLPGLLCKNRLRAISKDKQPHDFTRPHLARAIFLTLPQSQRQVSGSPNLITVSLSNLSPTCMLLPHRSGEVILGNF